MVRKMFFCRKALGNKGSALRAHQIYMGLEDKGIREVIYLSPLLSLTLSSTERERKIGSSQHIIWDSRFKVLFLGKLMSAIRRSEKIGNNT